MAMEGFRCWLLRKKITFQYFHDVRPWPFVAFTSPWYNQAMHKVSPFFLFFLISANALAQSPSDFDQDGISDPVAVSIDANQTLNWQGLMSSTSSKSSLGQLGQNGDHIILGRWTSALKPSIGTISKEKNGKATWRILTELSVAKEISLGSKNSTFISGADLNGNGTLDAAVVNSSSKGLNWKIRLDPFLDSGLTNRVITRRFGARNDTPFFIAFPTGPAHMAVLTKDSLGRTWIKSRSLSGRIRSVRVAGLDPTSKLEPIIGPDSNRLLLLKSKSGSSSILRFIKPNGRTSVRTTVPGTGFSIIGNFTASPGQEVAIQDGTTLHIFNPFDRSLISQSGSTGILVDEININKFGSTPATPNPTPPGNGSFTPPPPGACQSGDPTDGPENFLWKPNSATQRFAVVGMPNRFTPFLSEVNVLKTNGETIKGLRKKSPGPRTFWQDDSLTGADYKNRYGRVIASAIFSNGGCINFLITNPSERTD